MIQINCDSGKKGEQMPLYKFTRTHLRFRRLARLVGRKEAVYHLHELEAYMCDFAPDGDLSSLSDGDIEEASEWDGDEGKWVNALRTTELLIKTPESVCQFRGWPEHAPPYVQQRAKRMSGRETKDLEQETAHNGAQCSPMRADRRLEGTEGTEPKGTGRDRTENGAVSSNSEQPSTVDAVSTDSARKKATVTDLPISRFEQRDLVELMRQAWKDEREVLAALQQLASPQPRLVVAELLRAVGIPREDSLCTWLPKLLTEAASVGGDRANDMKHFLQGLLELHGKKGVKKPAAMLTKILRERGVIRT